MSKYYVQVTNYTYSNDNYGLDDIAVALASTVEPEVNYGDISNEINEENSYWQTHSSEDVEDTDEEEDGAQVANGSENEYEDQTPTITNASALVLYAQVYDAGCLTGSGGLDCEKACLDSAAVWGKKSSPMTFANCALLPFLISPDSTLDFTEAGTGNQGNESFQRAAVFDYLGVSPNFTNVAGVNNTIQTCFNDYCKASNCTWLNPPTSLEPQELLSSFSSQLGSICKPSIFSNNPSASVSSDVGGPGVVISYGVQYGLALLGWMALKFLTSLVYDFSLWIFPGPFLGFRSGGWPRVRRMCERWQESVHSINQTAALTAALVDFQKAQCCFTIAVQIAALIQFSNKINAIGATSPIQVRFTYQFMTYVALGSAMSVCLTALAIYGQGSRSRFVWILSCIALALCSAVVWPDWIGSASQAPVNTSANLPIASCGNSNPFDHCSGDYSEDPVLPGAMLAGCWVGLGLIGGDLVYYQLKAIRLQSLRGLWSNLSNVSSQWAEKSKHTTVQLSTSARHHIKARPSWQKLEAFSKEKVNTISESTTWNKVMPAKDGRVRQLARTAWERTKEGFTCFTAQNGLLLRIFKILFNIIIYLLEIYFAVSIILISVHTIVVFKDKLNLQRNSWLFGQVIAIFVWTQPILDYIRAAIAGIEKSSEHRITKPFKVVREDQYEVIIEPGRASAKVSSGSPMFRSSFSTLASARDREEFSEHALQCSSLREKEKQERTSYEGPGMYDSV